MIASKGRLFGDDKTLLAVIASDTPREQKHLKCQVRRVDPVF